MPAQTVKPRASITQEISPVILGGAAWSHQINAYPETLPVIPVILRAFELGIRTIDTSPYYEPSEQILGKALSSSTITSRFRREEYFLMTKVGRVKAEEFRYDEGWVRYSVERSLERFETSYLDVVFCHDVEYVCEEEVLGALAVLWEFVKQGKIRYVGVSGYPIEKLVSVVQAAKEKFGRPVDVVQSWGQMTLQNERLKNEGLRRFRVAGVGCVCSSSPLNIGLLREKGVPEGSLGDWHPAPGAMRRAVAGAAAFVRQRAGEDLADLALRYAFVGAAKEGVKVIVGPSSVVEIEGCARAAWSVRRKDGKEGGLGDLRDEVVLDEDVVERDAVVVREVRRILGEWIDYCFVSPPVGWDVRTKKMVEDKSG